MENYTENTNSNNPTDEDETAVSEDSSDKENNERKSFREKIGSFKLFKYWWWPSYEDFLFKLSIAIIVLLIWGVAYASTGHHAAPGGGIFNVGILVITAYIWAKIQSYIAIPPLISMLIVGLVFRNAKIVDIKSTVPAEILSQIRCVALTMVLIRAGLGLDPVALKKLSLVVPRLAFTPCLVEIMGATAASYFILNFPIDWGLLLGSTLGAVSPAVTVHYLLALKEQRYGTEKGIPTLIIAASSIDDIFAITIFGIIMSISLTSDSLIMKILTGPMEVLIGLLCGAVIGITAIFLPHDNKYHVAFYRSLIIGSGSLFVVLGSRRFGIEGAGYIASIVTAFVASYGWKKRNWAGGGIPVQHAYLIAWQVIQHFLFSLIGYELDLSELSLRELFLQIATLTVGLTVRLAATLTVLIGAGFNFKEKLFVMIAWIPKATVQAALGPTALDIVKEQGLGAEEISYAKTILCMAVLAILITAPLGALGILFTGPKLLNKELTELERRWLQFKSMEEPPKKKRICSCTCSKSRENVPEKYITLHRDSMLLEPMQESLLTVA